MTLKTGLSKLDFSILKTVNRQHAYWKSVCKSSNLTGSILEVCVLNFSNLVSAS